MAAMTDADLADEIRTDPAGLGYAPHVASGYVGAIVALLNDRGRGYTVPHAAPWSSVLKWLAQKGYRSKLEDAANTAGNANRDTALAILDLVRGAAPNFDVTDPGTVALFGAIITLQADRDALKALGNVPASRAEVRWTYGTAPTVTDVSRALGGTP